MVLPDAAHAEKRFRQHNAGWSNPSIVVPVTLAGTVAGPLRAGQNFSCSRVDDRESGWILIPVFKEEPEYVKSPGSRLSNRDPQLRNSGFKDKYAAFMEKNVVLREDCQVLFQDRCG